MNAKDYHTNTDHAKEYFSVSQWKSFTKCESMAVAELDGTFKRRQTDALTMGNLFDTALLTPGLMPSFLADHPEMVSTRGESKGDLKSAFKAIADMAMACRSRNNFDSEYWLEGDKQVVLTGEIAGHKWRGMLDVCNTDNPRIIDVKTTRDFKPLWDERIKAKVPFYEYWGYWLQAAIYKALYKQTFGFDAPFYIVAFSKEYVPQVRIFEMGNAQRLFSEISNIENKTEVISAIKSGGVEPGTCGLCDYCKKVVPVEVEIAESYVDFTGENIEAMMDVVFGGIDDERKDES